MSNEVVQARDMRSTSSPEITTDLGGSRQSDVTVFTAVPLPGDSGYFLHLQR